jgi:hypothetical protein
MFAESSGTVKDFFWRDSYVENLHSNTVFNALGFSQYLLLYRLWVPTPSVIQVFQQFLAFARE